MHKIFLSVLWLKRRSSIFEKSHQYCRENMYELYMVQGACLLKVWGCDNALMVFSALFSNQSHIRDSDK